MHREMTLTWWKNCTGKGLSRIIWQKTSPSRTKLISLRRHNCEHWQSVGWHQTVHEERKEHTINLKNLRKSFGADWTLRVSLSISKRSCTMHHSAIYPNCVAPLKLANSVSSGSQHGKAIATSCRRWLTKKKAKKLFSVTYKSLYKSLGCFENKREKNLFYSNTHSLNKTAKPLVITVQVGLLLCIKNISPPTMRERALILNKAIEKKCFWTHLLEFRSWLGH